MERVDPGTNVLPGPVYSDDWVTLYCGDQAELVPLLGKVDAVITDPPYSARTHECNKASQAGASDLTTPYPKPSGGLNFSPNRRALSYGAWSPQDAGYAATLWHDAAAGWCVVMTDHNLAPAYEAALSGLGRYVFVPIAYLVSGSRVRLAGDGPANWAVQIVPARPKTTPYAKWGALPGGYVLPPGQRETKTLVGGKELWIMRELVRDYSREDDTVLDPCAGAGTTLVAARDMRRKSIGIEIDPETAQLAATRLANTKGRMVQQRLAMGE